jgi:hypothetical protein
MIDDETTPTRIGRRRVLRDLGIATLGGAGIAATAGAAPALAAATAVTAINVKDAPFGAKGDGTTDDRAAIQLALDDVGTRGGEVFFPPGDYVVSGPLVPKARTVMTGCHSPQWIGGSNPASACKIRARTGFAGAGLIVPTTTSVSCSFRNLALVGGNVGTGVHGMRLPAGAANISYHLENMTIAGFSGSGIFGKLHVGTLDNCFVHDNARWGVEASGGEPWYDVHVANCFLFYNRSGNLYFGGSGTTGAVDFVNCRFERAGTNPLNVLSPLNPSAPGVRVASGRLINFVNCTTDANCGNGFEIVHEADTPGYFPNNITLTSCRFNRDGTGDQSTLGEYAGLKVRGTDTGSGSAGQIKAINCMTLAGKADDSGGGTIVGPKYGVWYENTHHFQWIGGNIDASGSRYRVGSGGNWRAVIYDVERGLFSLPLERPAATTPTPDGSAYFDAATSRLHVHAGGVWKSTLLS